MLAFALSIFYFVLFGFVIYRFKFFQDEHISRHWLLSFFGVKIIVSVILTAIYTHYYTNRELADIYKYFDDSRVLYEALKTNPLDYIQLVLGLDFDSSYFQANYYSKMQHWTRPFGNDLVSDSHIIIRLNAFFRIFSFGEIMVHNVFMNFISFTGLFMVYKQFKAYTIQKEKLLFFAIATVPSVLFWGSGVLKEGIILFAIGLILLGFNALMNRIWLKGFISFGIGLLLLTFTKFYLLAVFFIPLSGYLLHKLINKKPWISYLTALLLFFALVNIAPLIHSELDIVNQIAMKQQSFSNFLKEFPANSSFEIKQLSDGASIIGAIPLSLLNTFVRPYPWEISSPFAALSFLENLLVLSFVLLSLRYRSVLSVDQKNILWFNAMFILGLYILIGLTTPVFGAIVRYKVPGMLFLFITLVILMDPNQLKSKVKWLNK